MLVSHNVYIIHNLKFTIINQLIDVAFKRTFSQAMTSKRKAAILKKKNVLTQALELKHYLLYIEIHIISCQHCTTPKYLVFI